MRQTDSESPIYVLKTRNIAFAVYLVTDLIPTDEPIGHRLKIHSLDVMSLLVNERDRLHSGMDTFQKIVGPKLEALRQLLFMAKMSGHVSEMNYRIVETEIAVLTDKSGRESHSQRIEGIIKGRKYFDDRTKQKEVNRAIKDMSDMRGMRGIVREESSRHVALRGMTEGMSLINSTDRRAKILKAFSPGAELSVRDLVSVIPVVSEKTIQRDLVGLVKDNLLKKKGDKRWSRYFLPS